MRFTDHAVQSSFAVGCFFVPRCRTPCMGISMSSGHRAGSPKRCFLNRGEPATGTIARAATLYSVGSARDPDHEAVIRFGGEAPRWQAHSTHGMHQSQASDRVHCHLGSASATSLISAAKCRETSFLRNRVNQKVQGVGHNTTPVGISPVVTVRQNAIRSFRANATIMVVLRAPCAVRAWYHCTSPQSFWNLRNRQASWIRPRRTRALPALARPFSRRFDPLSSGEPVSPA